MDETLAIRHRQRGGFKVHRPDCHEVADVMATQVQTIERHALASLVGPLSPCRKCSPDVSGS